MQADFNTAAVPVMTVNEVGTKEWRLNGLLHREDGPAVEYTDGTKSWYCNDKVHRDDGPAIVWADGGKEWYRNDQLHRDDGPAVERADGYKSWWLNGMRHREDGPAVINRDGSYQWVIKGREADVAQLNLILKRFQKKLERLQQQKTEELRNAITEAFTTGFASDVVAPTTARFKPKVRP